MWLVFYKNNNMVRILLGIITFFGASMSVANDAAKGQQPSDTQSIVDSLISDRQHANVFTPQLQLAWDSLTRANPTKAIQLFSQVLESPDATDAEHVQALFGVANSYAFGIGVEDMGKAKHYYKQIVDGYPDNPATPWALMKLGQLQGRTSLKQRQASRTIYEKVIRQYPSSLAIHEASLRLATMYFLELDPNLASKGIDVLEKHIEKHPDNPLASLMHFRISYWYQEVNRDYVNGLKHSLAAAELAMADPKRQSMVYWNIAQIYRIRRKNPAEAIKWYQKIVDEFPREYFVFPAKYWAQKLTETSEEQTDRN